MLTREAIKAEGVPGGFAGLYPVLKLLEDGGRVRRGYFVAGLGGAQFAVPGAVDRLRAFREPPLVPEVTVLAAVDPANAYGAALPWPVKGPQRAAGAYVLLVDGLPSLYIEKGGRSIVALRPYDGEWEDHVVRALSNMVGPEEARDRHVRFRRLVLENGARRTGRETQSRRLRPHAQRPGQVRVGASGVASPTWPTCPWPWCGSP